MSATAMWTTASIAMVPPLGLLLLATQRHSLGARLVGLQAATGLVVLLLAMLTFVIDQPSSIDLAVSLALLSLPGSLVAAVFVERWL